MRQSRYISSMGLEKMKSLKISFVSGVQTLENSSSQVSGLVSGRTNYIVLVASTPNAKHKMPSICNRFAADSDNCLNASKSKCVVIHAKNSHLPYFA